MYHVYILQNQSKTILYKGITNCLSRRLKEHNDNKSPGTRGKGPWKIIYSETCDSRCEARKREKQLKSGCMREQISSFIDLQ